MQQADVGIIGGGILGLATGYEISQRFPQLKVVVLEKEAAVAQHQSGRNSGVLHSGIYYKPGSLKAENCRLGKLAMQKFCDEQEIPYELCGKVIVATDELEVERLHNIYERGQANKVDCRLIERDELLELEPHAAGIKAIHVPETGIADYPAVCRRMADLIRERDGEVLFNARVSEISSRMESVVLSTTGDGDDVECRYLVNCAGLFSDRIAKMAGCDLDVQIMPFRGEFFHLKPTAEHLCRTLIYPVPDPDLPFLGVHFTKRIGGGVECGPNAVLATAREGYRLRDFNSRDWNEAISSAAFRKLIWKNRKTAIDEAMRSLSQKKYFKALWRFIKPITMREILGKPFTRWDFVASLQKLVPDIKDEDIEPAPAGVRAQAVDRDGNLVDDFLFRYSERAVHVVNAPSPAATSSLNIARLIVDRLAEQF